MTAFDRDAALEQQQIREISDNVTRRLLKALDRCRYLPPMLATEVGASARAVSDIQREIDHLMAAWPPHDPLDIAVLTHVLGSQQHALGLLEELEAKLQTAQPAAPQPVADPAHAHRALLAASRDIEAEAMRHAVSAAAQPQHHPQPQVQPPPWTPPARPAAQGYAPPPAAPDDGGWPAPQPPAQAPRHPQHAAKSGAAPRRAASAASRTLTSLHAILTGPSAVATLTALTVATVLIAGVMSLMPPPDPQRAARQSASLAPGQKLDGRLGAPGESAAARPDDAATTFPVLGLTDPAAAGAMEQPYLVVLATRRSTDELQKDYQAFKAAYPDLLGSSKARVDRLQGQDRQSWYRLSLVPPQAHGDAKTLCRNLKAAGLTGCWIKQVPLN